MIEKQLAIHYFLPVLDGIQASCCDDCANLRLLITTYIKNHLAEEYKEISKFGTVKKRRPYRMKVPRNNKEIQEVFQEL